MSRILITGASGFVGRHLCRTLVERGFAVRGAVRRRESIQELEVHVEPTLVGEIGPSTDWQAALANIDAVVHLAARVHVLNDKSATPLAEFRRVNVEGLERLARSAAGRVRRLVVLSSAHAMCSLSNSRLHEQDACRPDTPYGQSKWEGELTLRRICAETGLDAVILRPPPVYGPGHVGNLARLLGWIDRGLPLPLGGVMNRRSLLYVGNLIYAIATCLDHPAATNETFLVADDEVVSTAELARRAGSALGKRARIVPAPQRLMRLAGRLMGKRAGVERLLGSLELDCSRIRQRLDWQPRFTLEQGLAATADWMRDHHEAIV